MAKFLGLVFSDRIKTEFINVRLTEHPYPALYVNYLYLTGALAGIVGSTNNYELQIVNTVF
ncbi:MAG: hypothetical protein V7L27_14465 [Nostoc sp.]|uniref:hypothetical protein n=1 Tax=Nostoc sp. TaxID=1180 RepID=UPI002FFAEEBA